MLFGAIAFIRENQNMMCLIEHFVQENLVRTIVQGLIEERKYSTNERVERTGWALPTIYIL